MVLTFLNHLLANLSIRVFVVGHFENPVFDILFALYSDILTELCQREGEVVYASWVKENAGHSGLITRGFFACKGVVQGLIWCSMRLYERLQEVAAWHKSGSSGCVSVA